MVEQHVPTLSGPIKAPGPLQRLRYNPSQKAHATKWARDWRLRWFRTVGAVMQHHATGELVALYSNDRDPQWRLALQAELEARPNGAAEVLAACQLAADEANRRFLGLEHSDPNGVH